MKSKDLLLIVLPLIASCLMLGSGCCDPNPKNSLPVVLDSTYSDTAIKDIVDRFLGSTDSQYYPIYSIEIKNAGIESDTFTLTYKRIRDNRWLLPVVVKQFVPAGEVRTFRTEGPIPDHGVPNTSDEVYLSFFVPSPDSIPIQKMKPEVTLSYGSTETGDESCGSPGETITLDISNWK
jgi:hypothetical protein